MNKCIECGKNLGIFEGYRHPVSNRGKYVCRDCFEKIDESMKNWREFIQSNSFNNESMNVSIEAIIKSWTTIKKNLDKIFMNRLGIKKFISTD